MATNDKPVSEHASDAAWERAKRGAVAYFEQKSARLARSSNLFKIVEMEARRQELTFDGLDMEKQVMKFSGIYHSRIYCLTMHFRYEQLEFDKTRYRSMVRGYLKEEKELFMCGVEHWQATSCI